MLNLGVLHHGFIVILLGLASFIVTYGIVKRYNVYKFSPKVIFYSIHWGILGLSWLFMVAQMYYLWIDHTALASLMFTIQLVFFSLSSVFLLLYLFSISFSFSTYKKWIVTAVSIIGAVLLGVSVLVQPSGIISNYWNAQLMLSRTAWLVYLVVFALPAVFTAVFNIVHGIGLYRNSRSDFNPVFFISQFPIIGYVLLFLIEYGGFFTSYSTIFLRLGHVVLVYIIFLIFFQKKFRVDLPEGQDFTIRFPLNIKITLFAFFTTIVPLSIAYLLLRYSFGLLIGQSSLNMYYNDEQMVQLRRLILISISSVGLMSFLFSLTVFQAFVKRIKEVLKGMGALFLADFSYRIHDLEAHDEISALSSSYNKMSDDLQSYQKEVDEYNTVLENRVDERTQDLEAKTAQAEELAAQNKQYYQQLQQQTDIIIDSMADALLVIDREGTIVTANKAFIDQFHLDGPPEGHSLWGLAMLDLYPEFHTMVDLFTKDGNGGLDYKVQLKPPLVGLLKCRVSAIPLPGNQEGIIIIMRNVTPPWGFVYEANTLAPLITADVRLFNEKNDKLVDSVRTDEVGRYVFYVSPGRYYIRVFKDGYHFPSSKKQGYRGEVIEVKTKDDAIIKPDILMDKS